MFNLEYTIGGRKVSQAEFLRDMKDSVYEEAHKKVKESVGRVRCPVHGTHPTNFRVVKSCSKINYEFTCCCEDLKAAVGRALQ